MIIKSLSQLDLTKQYTYADYLKWQIEDRLELFSGYISKVAAPARKHQLISRNLERVIDAYLYKRNCEWYHAPFDVRLAKYDKTKDKDKQH